MVFSSDLLDLLEIIVMHKTNKKKRNLPLQDEISFFKNKSFMHNLQKELRMITAWSVNKKIVLNMKCYYVAKYINNERKKDKNV